MTFTATPTRGLIVAALRWRPRTVTELTEAIGIKASGMGSHLRWLTEHGQIVSETLPGKGGTRRYHAVVPDLDRDADVLDSLRTNGPCSIAQLVVDTGRSRVEVRIALASLVALGSVETSGLIRWRAR